MSDSSAAILAEVLTDRLFGDPKDVHPGRAEIVRRRFTQYALSYLANRPFPGLGSTRSAPKSTYTAGELDALQSVGAVAESWTDPTADPLADSLTDYVAFLETSLTTSAAAKRLKLDVSRIRQRIREGSLYAVEHDDGWRLPLFQFERRSVLPGLAHVLASLPRNLHPLDVAEWFLNPHPDLEWRESDAILSPREWLVRGGNPAEIEVLARRYE